jgi:spermidine synthase
MAAVSKENLQSSVIIHTVAIIVVPNAMFSGSRNFLKWLKDVERRNDTKIQNVWYFKQRKFQNFLIYQSRVMILESKHMFSEP